MAPGLGTHGRRHRLRWHRLSLLGDCLTVAILRAPRSQSARPSQRALVRRTRPPASARAAHRHTPSTPSTPPTVRCHGAPIVERCTHAGGLTCFFPTPSHQPSMTRPSATTTNRHKAITYTQSTHGKWVNSGIICSPSVLRSASLAGWFGWHVTLTALASVQGFTNSARFRAMASRTIKTPSSSRQVSAS